MNLSPSRIKKIGIFRALQLGDMLCIIPAARALRNAYPEAEIDLIGLPWASTYVSRFHKYFNRFIHFPGYPGLPEQEFDQSAYTAFERNIIGESFDLIIQMQGNGTIVNDMMSTWGTQQLAGFILPGMPAPSDLFIEYPEGIHEIHRHLKLMTALGIQSQDDELEFPVNEEEIKSLRNLNLPYSAGEYVIIHPGSRGSYRQWPPRYFAEAARLCHDLGYSIVLTGINGEEDIVDEVAGILTFPFFNACGKTTLGAAAVLIKEAAFIICNCTGVSHIAAAMHTPGIIISMDGEPERWGPLNKNLHCTINWLKDPRPDFVFNELKKLLQVPKRTMAG